MERDTGVIGATRLAVAVTIRIFFFKDTATTEIYTLSLHDALPILPTISRCRDLICTSVGALPFTLWSVDANQTPIDQRVNGKDRKSTRLNSSHVEISYAVFCLKKKNNQLAAGHF